MVVLKKPDLLATSVQAADRQGRQGRMAGVDALRIQAHVRQLFDCAQQGELKAFKAALRKAELSSLQAVRDEYGRSMLHYAAQAGHLQLVKYLTDEQGFSVDIVDSKGALQRCIVWLQ
jgi:hypothetical protein